MVKVHHFLARALFLAFFALNAWNTLRDLDRFHLSFSSNYGKFEKAFTKLTNIRFPDFMASSYIDKNSEMFVRMVAYGQFVLCGLALLIAPSLTALVGLVYFLLSIIHFNVLDINCSKIAEWEPIALSIALLAASFYLALPRAYANVSRVAAKAKAASAEHQRSEQQKNKKQA